MEIDLHLINYLWKEDHLFLNTKAMICENSDLSKLTSYYHDNLTENFDETNRMGIETKEMRFDTTKKYVPNKKIYFVSFGCEDRYIQRQGGKPQMYEVWTELRLVENQLEQYWRDYANKRCSAMMAIRVVTELWNLMKKTCEREDCGAMDKDTSAELKNALLRCMFEIYVAYRQIMDAEEAEQCTKIAQMMTELGEMTYGIDPIFSVYAKLSRKFLHLLEMQDINWQLSTNYEDQKKLRYEYGVCLINTFERLNTPGTAEYNDRHTALLLHALLSKYIKFEVCFRNRRTIFGKEVMDDIELMRIKAQLLLETLHNTDGEPMLSEREIDTIMNGYCSIIENGEPYHTDEKTECSQTEKRALKYRMYTMFHMYRTYLKLTYRKIEENRRRYYTLYETENRFLTFILDLLEYESEPKAHVKKYGIYDEKFEEFGVNRAEKEVETLKNRWKNESMKKKE